MNHQLQQAPIKKPQQFGLDDRRNSILRQTPPSARLVPQPRREPLVLNARSPPTTAAAVVEETPARFRFFSSTTSQTTASSSDYQTPHAILRTCSSLSGDDTPSAGDMAREASQAGFLHKLGANVEAFKRRFFILQPGTHLYYFLSPDDTSPRGCLDLEGSQICRLGELPDGRYRFAIQWPLHKVVLEARSRALAEEWMSMLETERLPYYKEELAKAKRKQSAFQSRIAELERQVADYKLIEKDRDGALEDAARWKHEFEALDESLRRLTQRMRRPLDGEQQEEANAMAEVNIDDEKKLEEGETESAQTNVNEVADKEQPSIETSLLDAAVENEEELDVTAIPGTHFGALYNTCEQLRENLRLASQEASTAVEDLHAANERVETVEKRMAKAEKHLCKLWEENCSVRKALKQKKRERRVLIREVKNLRDAAAAQRMDWSGHERKPLDDKDATSLNGSDEEKLINELEEHLMTSIRLHEQLLGSNGAGTGKDREAKAEAAVDASFEEAPPVHRKQAGPTVTFEIPEGSDRPNRRALQGHATSRPVRATASLFDDDSEDETQTEDEAPDIDSVSPSISSLNVEASDVDCADDELRRVPSLLSDSVDSTPERKNPLLLLDEEESDQPQLCAASSQSDSSKSALISNGQATSKLVCPLADVVDTRQHTKNPQSVLDNSELEVYHLTFYSQKIGLQFQKVPPPPAKAKGLLTDAMTADLTGVSTGSSKTAAELRRIAAISTRAKLNTDGEDKDVCQVAAPVDAVLVCGFVGFDDTGNNVRPKLGARLVAFDGVSVEVGRWTFESIRKAIQARDRPLTLSFRNDFLTIEQRTILTTAVDDVAKHSGGPRRTLQYHPRRRRPSLDPSVHSALTHESDLHDIRSDDTSTSASVRTASVSGSDSRPSLPQSFSGARSFGSNNVYSFSEAGSSTSVLSAVAPLVSNLLARKSSEPFTPDYLRRAPTKVEDTPQHEDFTSGLL